MEFALGSRAGDRNVLIFSNDDHLSVLYRELAKQGVDFPIGKANRTGFKPMFVPCSLSQGLTA